MKMLQLANSESVALLDDGDFAPFNRFKWHIHSSGRVVRSGRGLKIMRTGRIIESAEVSYYLHREVMGIRRGDNRVVTHLDGDFLNNQRDNLRVVDRTQLPRRKRSQDHKSSRYTGISPPKDAWIVRITSDGQRHYLGRFPLHEEELAASVYDEVARILHGARAALNFPDADIANRAATQAIMRKRSRLAHWLKLSSDDAPSLSAGVGFFHRGKSEHCHAASRDHAFANSRRT